MMPGVFEFRWDVGHVLFLGAFLLVLVCLATTVSVAWRRARHDRAGERTEAIRWHTEFEELPASCRACRHSLGGTLRQRTCENGFECGSCEVHTAVVRTGARASAEPIAAPGGLEMPAACMYDRGHTVVEQRPDGAVCVALDPLAARLIGTPEAVELPPPGTRLHRHTTAWRLVRNGLDFEILSPIDGVVLTSGDAPRGGSVELAPTDGAAPFDHLLQGAEARVWMLREIERLQQLASSAGLGASLADGGTLAVDFAAQLDEPVWQRLCDDMLLQV